MEETCEINPADWSKRDRYRLLAARVDAVLAGEDDPILWMATVGCLLRDLFHFLWVGFYRIRGEELIIGPYQGSLACLRIPLGKGVCGTAAARRETVLVPNVHDFPGHIACDSRSNAEIVVPVFGRSGELRGVLDIDSQEFDAFDDLDCRELEALVARMRVLAWTDNS